ncbi:MAG: flavoprotein [Microbacterium sp.]|nr:flavoprotein [Microbacterium sp.]MBN9209177.1 NAD(P)-binding domain-containing protein [Microbacterium ginsengisoli]
MKGCRVPLLDLTPRPRGATAASTHPVVVIGAGPVGLAAAAHLLERSIDTIVFEAGESAGAAVRSWGHVALFSPWRYLVDPAAGRLLAPTGWLAPDPDEVPTGADVVTRYLEPLAQTAALSPRITTGARVVAVTRLGRDRTRSDCRGDAPFVVRVRRATGEVESVLARAVIDASGTLDTPNPIGGDGLPPLGLDEVGSFVLPPLPDVLGRDRARLAGRSVAVVGTGHSAAHTLLALAELSEDAPGTRAVWVRRRPPLRPSTADDLPERERLGSRLDALVDAGVVEVRDGFLIERVSSAGDGVRVSGVTADAPAAFDVDLVVAATGFRPDLTITRELRLDFDEVSEAPRRLAPLIDPNLHSCGTVAPHGFAELRHPEPGFFTVGMKSYGRAPTFLLATGYEQVRSVAAWLAGDLAAARAVVLDLPATGVCSTDRADAGGCCA